MTNSTRSPQRKTSPALWLSFTASLQQRGLTFAAIALTSEKRELLQALGFVDALVIAALETEWQERLDAAGGSDAVAAAALPTGEDDSRHPALIAELATTQRRAVNASVLSDAADATAFQQQHAQGDRAFLSAITNDVCTAIIGLGSVLIERAPVPQPQPAALSLSTSGVSSSGVSHLRIRSSCPKPCLPIYDRLLRTVVHVGDIEATIARLRVDESESRILDGFATAAQEELTHIAEQAELVMVRGATGGFASLTQLQTELMPIQSAVGELHRLVCDEGFGISGVQLLSKLFESEVAQLAPPSPPASAAANAQRDAGELGFTVAHRLLRGGLAPLCVSLSQWLNRGVLDDPHGEFFIGLNKTAKSLASLASDTNVYVAGSPYVCHLNRCPSFLRQVAPMVLRCGAYLAMLAGKDEANVLAIRVSRMATTGDAWDVAFGASPATQPQRSADGRGGGSDVLSGIGTDVTLGILCGDFETRFTPRLAARLAECSAAVMARITAGGQLPVYIAILEDVFLGAGGVMWDLFFDAHYDEMNHAEVRGDAPLRFVVDEFARRRKRFAAATSAGIIETSLHFTVESSLTCASVLCCDFFPPPQIALVISPEVAKKMSQAFKLMSRLRWVRRILTEIHRDSILRCRAENGAVDARLVHMVATAGAIAGQLLAFWGAQVNDQAAKLRAALGLTAEQEDRGGSLLMAAGHAEPLTIEESERAFARFADRLVQTCFLSSVVKDSCVAALVTALENFTKEPCAATENAVVTTLRRCTYMGNEDAVGLWLDFANHYRAQT